MFGVTASWRRTKGTDETSAVLPDGVSDVAELLNDAFVAAVTARYPLTSCRMCVMVSRKFK